MKRFLSTFGICLALVAGASIALVLAVLVCILVHQNDRLEALEKRTRQLEEQIQKQND